MVDHQARFRDKVHVDVPWVPEVLFSVVVANPMSRSREADFRFVNGRCHYRLSSLSEWTVLYLL